MSNVISLCAARKQANDFAERFYELAIIENQTPAQQKEFAQLCNQFSAQQLADLANTALTRANQLK